MTIVSSAALTIVTIGVMLGIPLGLAAQRSLWSTLETNIGFVSPWYANWLPVVVVALAFPVAAAIGAAQGALGSQQATADALRDE